MKKLLIGLFVCLCCTSCIPITEKYDSLIVVGSTDTNIKEGVTTYIIRAYDQSGGWINAIRYKAKLGTFEIGDTVVIVKK
jgi:hypothetical protein